MTRLEAYQRGLLDLVKERDVLHEDPYLRTVASSGGLVMTGEIAIWWRKFQLESQCPLTSSLLKRLGCFDDAVVSYFNQNRTSPFVEELSIDFLRSFRTHHDPLVKATSQCELALLLVLSGSDQQFEILWDRHPDHVFRALEHAAELPSPELGCVYRMRICKTLPGLVTCSAEVVSADRDAPLKTARELNEQQ